MKNKPIYIFVLFLLLHLTSCGKKYDNFFAIDDFRNVHFNTEIDIKGEEICFDDLSSALSFRLMDSLLFVVLSDRDHYLDIYNIHSGKKYGEFCLKGRGPKELLYMRFNEFYKDNSGRFLLISDLNQRRLFKFFIDSSLVSGQTCIIPEMEIPATSRRGIWYRKDEIVCENIDPVSGELSLSAIHPDDSLSPLMILNKEAITMNDFSMKFAYSYYYNGSKDKMVMSMKTMNQINIIDMGKNRIMAVSTDQRLKSWAEFQREDVIHRDYYYSGVDGNNLYFISLFINRREPETATKSEFHLFDWNGKPVVKIMVPDNIRIFCVDATMSVMYGLTYEDKLFRYDLKF